MSRIGKEPVKVPAGATVAVQGGVVAVKGPKGELKYTLPPGIECKVEDGVARFARSSDDRRARAFHGLARALVANMVEGVVKGYAKALDIEGVGFKFDKKGKDVLALSIGYAEPKLYKIPAGVDVAVGNAGLHVDVTGIDKQLVGRVAADIRAFKPAEPYKGKGIRYTGEKIRRKEGKTVA
ncbi:MAG: 50S ribosomal protein L6 [Kiritimatiellae bacterium]|nr:50S ribosomal protein L6 [Kiritimatiellia bacterium]